MAEPTPARCRGASRLDCEGGKEQEQLLVLRWYLCECRSTIPPLPPLPHQHFPLPSSSPIPHVPTVTRHRIRHHTHTHVRARSRVSPWRSHLVLHSVSLITSAPSFRLPVNGVGSLLHGRHPRYACSSIASRSLTHRSALHRQQHRRRSVLAGVPPPFPLPFPLPRLLRPQSRVTDPALCCTLWSSCAARHTHTHARPRMPICSRCVTHRFLTYCVSPSPLSHGHTRSPNAFPATALNRQT